MKPTSWVARFERNTRIVEAFADGKSVDEIRAAFKMARNSVLHVLYAAGIHPNAPSRMKVHRNQAMAKASQLGAKLATVAELFHVSLSRAHQVIARERQKEDPELARGRHQEDS